MFKKALQIAVSFCLLVGGYAGYARLFAIVAAQLGESRDDALVPFPETDSKSARRANELARESFPPGHWAAQNVKLQYYEAAHGYYMYAQNYERLKDGKQLRIWPFALIWVSKDGLSHKTATSDEAVIDLSQPFGMMKQGNEPSRIVHARMMGDVRLRDDKGTRDVPEDDLRVGPLTYIEYDEKSLQITSDSEVFLQDRDLTLTGVGLLIQLRRKVGPPSPGGGVGGSASGFDAETTFVYKDVHVTVNNVTANGVLPGTAKPEKSGKTPLDVRSDREMRIDLPRPHPPVLVGPPYLDRPADPTLVKFRTNVRVIRGTDKTDQLNCDTLDLTLMPPPRPPENEDDPAEEGDEVATVIVAADSTPVPAKPSSGPLTELKLRKAVAQGDAVWLQSEAQGMVARCIELIYEKHEAEGTPDVTYLNGGPSKKLWVEKVEYDTQSATPGAIKSIMRLTALDATIFDSGPAGFSNVIARGPGKTEERPARNASVTRTAWWEDEMKLLSWREGEGATPNLPPLAVAALRSAPAAPSKGTLRRLITLTGVPKLVDHNSSTTLDARKSIVAEFQAGPKADPKGGDGPTQIQWLDANEDAHLTAPNRTLTARRFLKAKFINPEPIPAAPAASAPAGPLVVAATPAPPPVEQPKPDPAPAPAPADPPVDARADRVWARLLLGSKNTKGDLKDAQLRGGVMVHQDPAPGKAYGSDASGEALDLLGQGNGLMKFTVAAEEPPQASDPKTRLASDSKGRLAPSSLLARVDFEGKTIESEKLIVLDQKADFAWTRGAGNFLQMADRGLLDDKGIEGETIHVAAKPTGPNPKDRLVITWTEEMRFYGKSRDLAGRPAAKIEFRGTSKEVRTPDGRREFRRGVEAKMTDSAIFCDTMDVYLDRVIALNKALNKDEKKPAPKSEDPASSDAQIALLDCRGQDQFEQGVLNRHAGVDITSQKLFPESGELKEKQRIQGIHVVYDKRTGDFEAPGPGLVRLYKRKNGPAQAVAVVPTALPVAAAANGWRPEARVTALKLPPLELTKVKFTQGMRGRFGTAKDQVETETRDAEFTGAVESANATVPHKNADIDFDRLERWPDVVFLTSDILKVFSVPPPVGSKAASRSLLNARGNAVARAIRPANSDTIQADRITYDSASELTYAYGDDGKEVSVTKQDSLGQRPTTIRGKSVRYNKATRESRFDDPQAIQFTDLKSGIRPKPYYPDTGGSPKPPELIKPQRLPLQRQLRNSTERNGFTGH